MNDIDVSKQTFINISFAQLHEFKLICFQQFRFFVMTDEKNIIFNFIAHFIIISFIITDKLENVYPKFFDIFVIKLNQYSIILKKI